MDATGDFGDFLFALAFAGGVPAYFVLQPLLAWRFIGGWRTAALAPLIVSLPLLCWCLYALARGSNIWPLPLVFFAPVGTLYLLLLFILRYWRTGRVF
ncbi:MAG: hypothetical protein WBQ17_02405 [Rhizomicrobium sp.]|jgi:hypothetical protein